MTAREQLARARAGPDLDLWKRHIDACQLAEHLLDVIEEAHADEWRPKIGDGVYHLRRKLLQVHKVLERAQEGRT